MAKFGLIKPEIWPFIENPKWLKIQDGRKIFKIDNVGLPVNPNKLK